LFPFPVLLEPPPSSKFDSLSEFDYASHGPSGAEQAQDSTGGLLQADQARCYGALFFLFLELMINPFH
jgi:hypothetical protein